MTDPSLCREVLEGVGTLAELERLRASGHENLYLQQALYLIGGAMTGNVVLHDWYSLARKEEDYDRLKSKVAATMEKIQAAKEPLAKEKVDFEAYKLTEEWATAAGHKQVGSLNQLLSQERKLWKEAYTRENEKFYRLHQEIVNLKAANTSLEKKEAATIAAMEKAIAGRNTTVRALEEANVGHTSVVKALEEAKLAYTALEVRDTTLADVNRHLVEAEAGAVKAEEERDGATSMNANLVADHA
ncbi:hypothetical protein HanRHA438_Chr08g0350681 [Helianthus annuus]|nr:hypothetical protein HanLR1_Chr08g0279171 [Helianthus annuus]KAJ0897889.1 hypothetical protein HanRHA438_Chr08g0350681 [Helianthus annuus]